MKTIVEDTKCTGCKLCKDICPTNSISFKKIKDGFWYPSINQESCINCFLCKKHCPSIHIEKINNHYDKPEVYAAWSLNEDIRYNSTSGGIYYEIGKFFIESNGYIAGCIYDIDYKSCKHIIGKTKEDLLKIMGSKYFQSDTDGIYKKINILLSQGKKVLFCGTPCQISALISIVGKNNENLYLLDFICKGINSPKAYKSYITELENKYHSKVTKVRLKSKKTGWESLATNIQFKNGMEYHKDRYTDWWIQGYTCGNLFMRECCQNCQYKTFPKQSDITFGDFWGIKNVSKSDKDKGISVVFINSQKGKELFFKLNNRLYFDRRSMEEVIEGNPYLFGQASQKGNREEFFKLIEKIPFSEAVKRTYTETIIQKIKRYIKMILKYCFKRKKW